MATVVYTGAGNGNGTLFQGMKFFLVQRLPTRKELESNLLANGGVITKIDNEPGTIIIADDARQNQPPGSYSWKWITVCLKSGTLEELKNYPADGGASRHGGVTASQTYRAKGGSRTPFTAEDDRILAIWVTKAERQGKAVKGNEIYKELERENPRHSFQSWRDRWVKYISGKPRPSIPEEDEDEDEIKYRAPPSSQPKHSTPRPAAPTSRPSNSTPAPSKSTPRPSKSTPRSSNSTPGSSEAPSSTMQVRWKQAASNPIFTDEDTEKLEAEYTSILNISEDKALDAWCAFADAHPTHTAQEWRNYFHEYVKPLREREEKVTKMEQARKQQAATEKARNKAAQNERAESSKMGSMRNKNQIHVTSRDPSPSASEENNDVAEDSFKGNKDPTLHNQDLFERELTAFHKRYPPEETALLHITLAGKEIPLFKIWQVVKSEPFGGFDVVEQNSQWPQVAKKLSFKSSQIPEVIQSLVDCYEVYLANFEDFRELNKAQFDWYQDDSQEDAMIQNQLFDTAGSDTKVEDQAGLQSLQDEQDDYDDDLEVLTPALPLRSSPRKRRELQDSPLATSKPPGKRQKIDKGKGKELEIPSTPETVYRVRPTQRQVPDISPLRQGKAGRNDPQATADAFTEEIDQEGRLKQPSFSKPKAKPSARPPIMEPETQDFHFLKDDDDAVSLESPPRVASEDGQDDSSTQSLTESQKEAEMDNFMEESESLGYKKIHILDSLAYTNGEIFNARLVMEELRSGRQVPDDLPGVWTKEDDAALLNPKNQKRYAKVFEKHGGKRVEERKAFLAEF